MNELKEIALDDIEEIKNYRELEPPAPEDQDIQELAQSIAKSGLWQPVLVRPHFDRNKEMAGKVQLIFGHRRLLAARIAGLHTIPAYEKFVPDDEILEAQVTENLHRKDPNAMDEGIAFKKLQEENSWSVEEISARFGKAESYVRQRLRLNMLTDNWQKIFFRKKLTLVNALKIAALSPADQKHLYEKEGPSKEEVKSGKYTIGLNGSDFSVYKGDLAHAAFDITDPFLDRKMGPCISCTFNSAVASLFPETSAMAHCNNTTCYKKKTEKSFELKLQNYCIDPSVLFVSSSTSIPAKDKDQLKKQYDIEVIDYGNYAELDEPTQPDYDQWREDLWDADELSPDEISEMWQKEGIDGYKSEIKEYQQAIATGKFTRALVVYGESKGKTIYITLNRKKGGSSGSISSLTALSGPPRTSGEFKEALKAGEVGAKDIDAEIARIKDRKATAERTDTEKTHARIREHLLKLPEIRKPGLKHQGKIDRGIMIFLLLELAGYNNIQIMRRKLKSLPDTSIKKGYQVEYFTKLAEISEDDLAFIVRSLCIDRYGNSALNYGVSISDTTIRLIAGYAGIDILSIEKEQSLIAAERTEKTARRIRELQDKKAGLAAKNKTPAKDAAAKKALKKATEKNKPRANHMGQELTDYGLEVPAPNFNFGDPEGNE